MTLETEAGAPSCRGVPRMGWQTPPWSISILFSPQMIRLKEQAKWQPAELEARLSCDLLSGSRAGVTVLWSAQLPGSPLVTRREGSFSGPFGSSTLQEVFGGVVNCPVGPAPQTSVPWLPASVLMAQDMQQWLQKL